MFEYFERKIIMFMKNRITALFLCFVMIASLTAPMVLANEINAGNIADVDITDDFWGPVDENQGGTTTGGTTGGATGGTTGGTTGGATGGVAGGSTGAETEEPETEEPKTVDFPDVKEQDWFYSDVRTLAGMGIINGYTDGTFVPQGNVTRAEFIKLIVSLKLKLGAAPFETEDKLFDDVDPKDPAAWYADYVTTAFMLGLINKEEYNGTLNPNEPITRREVARITVRALGGETGKYKTPYVDADDANITALYAMCIMQGNVNPETAERFFYPDTQITRAETSAVILRVYKYSLDADKYVQDFKSANAVKELEVLKAPVEANEFYNELTNAWENSQAFLIYEYDYMPGDDNIRKVKEEVFEAFRILTEHNPEYSTYISLNMEIQAQSSISTMKLNFSSNCDEFTYEELCKNSVQAMTISKDITDEVTQNCTTDIEKANAIHDYLCEKTEYDETLSPLSYTANGTFTNGKAVCQGYSAAFNVMCKAANVKSLSVANNDHMWNVVLTDGVLYHYDVTFDDTGEVNTYKGIANEDFVPDEEHRGYVLPDIEFFI